MERLALVTAIPFVILSTVARIGVTWWYQPKSSARNVSYNILVCTQHFIGLGLCVAFAAIWCTKRLEPDSLWPTLVLAQAVFLSTVQPMLDIRSWFASNASEKVAVVWAVTIGCQIVLTGGAYLAEKYSDRCRVFTGLSLLVVSIIGVGSFVGVRRTLASLSGMDFADGFTGLDALEKVRLILNWLWLPGLFYILVPVVAVIPSAKTTYLVAYFMTLPWTATLLYLNRIVGRSNPNRDTTQPLSSPTTLSSA